jgi:hypothetical protein
MYTQITTSHILFSLFFSSSPFSPSASPFSLSPPSSSYSALFLPSVQVDVPALRRMNRRHKPNLTRDNMSYYRPPSPTPEERRLLRKQMAKEKAAGSGMGTGGGKSGMSKEHMDKANKELDALFAE